MLRIDSCAGDLYGMSQLIGSMIILLHNNGDDGYDDELKLI